MRGVPSGCIFACVHMESAPTAPQLPPRAPEQPFALLADRTRLRLLMLLEEGRARGRELCVGDLVEVLELPQPSVSRHLGRLRRAGWVAARRRDPWVFYSLSPQAAAGHLTRLLELCDRSLRTTGAERIADARLLDIRRRLSTFGLNLVRLDIRQDSAVHARAMDALTRYLNLRSYLA